ncbi:MAG: nuclear transport factor 2 family protein [Anaerolineales bacterium]
MSPIRMSKVETALRLALDFTEALNRHDVGAMMQLMSEDCIFENTTPAPDGTRYSGKESVARFWEDFFRNSPQAHIEIEDAYGMGHYCVMLWRYTWVNASGTAGYVRGIDLFKERGGLLCEKLSYVKG